MRYTFHDYVLNTQRHELRQHRRAGAPGAQGVSGAALPDAAGRPAGDERRAFLEAVWAGGLCQ